MFKKRAQGISITIIVAAVIGLIIIVIVIAMVTDKLGGFSKGAEETSKYSKECDDYDVPAEGDSLGKDASIKGTCGGGENEFPASDAIATGKKCCRVP